MYTFYTLQVFQKLTNGSSTERKQMIENNYQRNNAKIF